MMQNNGPSETNTTMDDSLKQAKLEAESTLLAAQDGLESTAESAQQASQAVKEDVGEAVDNTMAQAASDAPEAPKDEGFFSSFAAKFKEAEHALEDALNMEHDSIAKQAELRKKQLAEKLTQGEHFVEDKLKMEHGAIAEKASDSVEDLKGKVEELHIKEKLSSGIDVVKEKLHAEEFLAKAKETASGLGEKAAEFTGKKNDKVVEENEKSE